MNILMKDKDGVTQHRHVTPETAEKKEILKKFTLENMADLLIGARVAIKRDQDTINWLLSEKERLEEELKELKKK